MGDKEKKEQEIKVDVIGPGQKLRAARQKKGLEIADVAKQLCLNKQFIIDIENDDYSHIPSLFYARGYLRAYAKLVGISEAEIITAFDSLGLSEKETAVDKSVLSSPKMKPFKKRSKRRHWFNLGIFVVLIVLIALWWQGRNKHTKPASLDDTVQQIIIPASS